MKLYLLRHGMAEDRAATDAGRILTAEGRRQAASAARQFRACRLPVGRCLVSPYLRARQTAEIFLPAASLTLPLETCEILRPEGRAADLLRFLQAQPEADILLVSHNPLLSELNALLRDGHVQGMTVLGTGELVGFSLDIAARGCATSLFHLFPDASPSSVASS